MEARCGLCEETRTADAASARKPEPQMRTTPGGRLTTIVEEEEEERAPGVSAEVASEVAGASAGVAFAGASSVPDLEERQET